MTRTEFRKIYLQLRAVFLAVLAPAIRIALALRIAPAVEPERILVICQPRLGDNIMLLPMLQALKNAYPFSHISLLVPHYVRDLFAAQSGINEVLAMRRGMMHTVRMVVRLRLRKFDLAIDANSDYTIAGALWAFFSGARRTVGYNVNRRGIFFSHALVPPAAERHTVDDMLELVVPLGVRSEDRIPRLTVSEQAARRIDSFLRSRDIGPGQALLGVHPGGQYPTQRWLIRRFANCIDRIAGETGMRAVVLGGPGDQDLLASLNKLVRSAPVFCSKMSIADFAALLRRCSVILCNNSGPLHLAAAAGTKTVSFMGPTLEAKWRPLGEGHIVLRRHELKCIGCNDGVCRIGTHHCMRLITVDDAVAAIKQILSVSHAR